MNSSLMVRIGAELSGLGKGLQDSQSMLQTFGSKMSQAGVALSLGLTAPIAAVGGTALKASTDFESAFANVKKTVEATEPQFAALNEGIRAMAQTIPVAATELASIAAIGGQFGVSTQGLLGFTQTVAELGVAVDGISGGQAAAELAQIANVTHTSEGEFRNLASTLVELGNKGNSTEQQILSFTQRLAGSGTAIGLTQAEIMGIGASMANLGLNAEAGGTAMSRVFSKMEAAVARGGESLQGFADMAGVSAQKFSDMFGDKPMAAVQSFIAGLGHAKDEGKSLTLVLDDMEMKDVRLTDTLKRLALANGEMSDQVKLATEEWRNNGALTHEANEKFKTTANQLVLLKNRLTETAMILGDALKPALSTIMGLISSTIPYIQGLATWFANLSGPVQVGIMLLVGMAASIGPLLLIAGQLISAVATVTALFAGPFAAALGTAAGIFSGVGLAIAAVTAVLYVWPGAWDAVKSAVSTVYSALSAFGSWLVHFGENIYTAIAPYATRAGEMLATIGGVAIDLASMALKPLEDAFHYVGVAVNFVWDAIKQFMPDLSGVGSAVKGAWASVKDAAGASWDWVVALGKNSDEVNNLITSTGGLDLSSTFEAFKKPLEPLKQLTESLKGAGVGAGELSDEAKSAAKALKEMVAGLNGTTAIAEAKMIESAVRAIGGVAKLSAGHVAELAGKLEDVMEFGAKVPESIRKLYVELSRMSDLKLQIKINKDDAAVEVARLRDSLQEWLKTRPIQLLIKTNASGVNLADTLEMFKKPLESLNKPGLFDGLGKKIGAELGGAIIGAFQGGGDVGKTIGGIVGKGFAEHFSEKASNLVGKHLGSALGGVMGTIMPGVGALAGQFLGQGITKLGGWLGGLFGDKEKKQTEEMRTKFIEAAGGLDVLKERAALAGVSLADLLSARRPEMFNAAMAAVQTQLANYDANVKTIKDRMSEVNAKLTEGAGLIEGLVGKGKELGFNFDTAGNLVSVSFDKMAERAKALGIPLEALGPAFQNARLHEMNQQIIDDFSLMTLGGASIGTTLLGLAEKISTVVQQSLAMGTQIPINMKPWIESLIAAGKLTDANGNKIETLEGMQFGEPVKSQYETIRDGIIEVNQHMDDLNGKMHELQGMLASVTGTHIIHIGWEIDPMPDVGGFGGMRPMATGGVVFGPTPALVGEAGPEAVMPLNKLQGLLDVSGEAGNDRTNELLEDAVRMLSDLPYTTARAVRDRDLVGG